jgi:hypothetical protein
MYKNNFFLAALAGSSFFMIPDTNASLIINLDFSSFSTGAPSDGSTILGGANLSDAQVVIEKAARYWESAFEVSSSSIGWSSNSGGTLTQNIAVGWGGQGGSTLASGGTNWFGSDGRWASGGSLTWDNDGSSSFYVDTDPTNSSEWNKYSSRDLTFNGVDMNAERVHYDAPAGVARSNSDMLTVAVHEIGHALGILPTFPAYAASDLGSDNDIDITSGVFNGAQIDIDGGHTNFLISTPAGGDFPYDPGGGSFFPESTYNPSVMGPSSTAGTRKLLTEADIAIVAQFLEYDMNTVNFNPSIVPEPSSILLLGLGSLALFVRRSR